MCYSIENLVLERAVPAESTELTDALGIEYCLCPEGYAGLSCQVSGQLCIVLVKNIVWV